MSKRNVLFIGIGLLVVLGISIIVYATKSPSALTSTSYKQAKNAPATSACLPANSKLTLSASQRNTVELAAISYLIDVPAGTNVDVNIATYSDTEVTGSNRYPAEFGSYNFVMQKQNGDWQTVKYTRCT